MALNDPDQTFNFGALMAELAKTHKVIGQKMPEIGADLGESPFEIVFVDGDGNTFHLKISEVTVNKHSKKKPKRKKPQKE